MLTFTFSLNVFPSTCLGLGYCYCVSLYFLSLFLPYVPCLVAVCQRELKSWLIDWLITFCQACSYPRNPYESYYQFRYLVNKGTMGVNSLPNTVTASRLRFEPRPSCAWVEHANHSATDLLMGEIIRGEMSGRCQGENICRGSCLNNSEHDRESCCYACSVVCLSVCHDSEPYKNRWGDPANSPGLRPRVTYSTSSRHISMSHLLPCVIC